jgi:regulatory protein
VEEADGADAAAYADDEAVEAALRLARRRRIGPFAAQAADQHLRQKWIAAMVRAGHGFPLAKAISGLPPDPDVDLDQIRDRFRSTEA